MYEPTPTEILSLLDNIKSTAKKLAVLLRRVGQLGNRTKDVRNPHRRAHLEWIHKIFLQDPASPHPEIDKVPEISAQSRILRALLLVQLRELQVAAAIARHEVNPKLLQRQKPQRDPALYELVQHAAEIWESMTGRRASVNKVHRRDGDTRPDFILFVTSIAKLAADYEPTATEITTAFNTWNCARKKTQNQV